MMCSQSILYCVMVNLNVNSIAWEILRKTGRFLAHGEFIYYIDLKASLAYVCFNGKGRPYTVIEKGLQRMLP